MESSKPERVEVKVDGEDAVLHITDRSVMFEKVGKVRGIERSVTGTVKPNGDAVIVAQAAGSELKSVGWCVLPDSGFGRDTSTQYPSSAIAGSRYFTKRLKPTPRCF